MSEELDQIRATAAPVTRARVAEDLGRLGVRPGSVLLVHSSMSALGWVCGRAQAVVEGLLDALGPDGTLVVPAHTNGNSDPAGWRNPPVPEAWWPAIREQMPGFDPRVTPARALGAIPELARTWPGARRSAHPHYSFAARRPARRGDHRRPRARQRASASARRSPASTTSTATCCCSAPATARTRSLHLAEHRVPDPPRETSSGAAVMAPDGRRWVDVGGRRRRRERLRAARRGVRRDRRDAIGRVGEGEARLMRQRELVEFAVGWMVENRR